MKQIECERQLFVQLPFDIRTLALLENLTCLSRDEETKTQKAQRLLASVNRVLTF